MALRLLSCPLRASTSALAASLLPRTSVLVDSHCDYRQASHINLKIIKHQKVRWHKTKKRWRKNRYFYREEYKTYMAAREKEFQDEMAELVGELQTFSPEAFVKEAIAKAKWKPPPKRLSGGAIYPHWSELMTMEELYGLPKDERIDLKAGLPSDEDWADILRLRKEYYAKYMGMEVGEDGKVKKS